ncbi:glucosylglycerolphosphate phosphatase [Pseudomonas straminea]|uniref:Glucosylglycerol 3-phosphatase n=2 Tax=Pseudomonas straminea TaxID=47882 RepID=A0A1I1TGJ4_PSEOC|nr:glucosylglycerolphosphate phosphatase [Pseudomonas straminea]SFD54670.1 glucosylglycerol 3-phosphatase [Pseudomonas straminea]
MMDNRLSQMLQAIAPSGKTALDSGAMIVTETAYSLDPSTLLDSLISTENLLIIQDLDGVCMDLVRDPLTRTLNPAYLQAARDLDGHFQVLTNGEHIGSRGVNSLVERALGSAQRCQEQGLYLPGLAAGGVQLQDRHGRLSRPGVSDQELAFLAAVPVWLSEALQSLLRQAPYRLADRDIEPLLASSVLDNPVSPTLNLNAFHHHWQERPDLYARLQTDSAALLQQLLDKAAAQGLAQSFFVHYAPNLGRNAEGRERLRPAQGTAAGTTDLQLMLRGSIKEAGVLVILNRYYGQRTGVYPLGEAFNVRQAPTSLEALLQLAVERFEPQHMPRLVGVGDTLTSTAVTADDGSTQWLRGGSDRGFLTLVQQLGEAFGQDNRVLYIDSSRGEVQRPGMDAAYLRAHPSEPWPALAGITDAEDPLRLDTLFAGGPRQYVELFCALASARQHG